MREVFDRFLGPEKDHRVLQVCPPLVFFSLSPITISVMQVFLLGVPVTVPR